MLRRGVGLLLCVIGAWFAFQSLQWAVLYTNRGAPLEDAILAPQFLLPFLRALFAMIGGVLAVLTWRGGAWFAWLATAISAIFPIGIIAMGGDQDLWMMPLILTVVFLALSLFLTLRPRTT